jgi:WhiB family redox-sensing transcriptional regulator
MTTPDAACAPRNGHDPDLWHADPGTADSAYAAWICSTCPLQHQCLEGALQRRERHGIWGGKTTPQRTAILLAAPRARAAA